MVDIIHQIAQKFPKLKEDLRKAQIKERPDLFIKRTLKMCLFFSLGITAFAFFMLQLLGQPMVFLIVVFVVTFFMFFQFLMLIPKNKINKRRRDLDKEVLFAGRFLLVKMHSGKPLLNALIDGSESYGVASKYFKEIVEDINLGTPIEQALDNAVKYSPSEKFRKVLFQINTAIKIGVDITTPLHNVIEEITNEQFADIQRYGKKLNSLALFYMLLAIVLPSLGMAMFVVIGGLLSLPINNTIFMIVIFFLVIIQFIFITIFKSTRLSVNF